MRVINFFAGPGVGKSTTSAGLFYFMKLSRMNVEIVTEFAKDLVWEERHLCLNDQISIFAQQNRKLERLRNKVDYAISDSPLLLGLTYAKDLPNYYQNLDALAIEVFNSYNNLNFFIERVKPYSTVGRIQDEAGAKKKDEEVKKFLLDNQIPFDTIPGNGNAVETILKKILSDV